MSIRLRLSLAANVALGGIIATLLWRAPVAPPPPVAPPTPAPAPSTPALHPSAPVIATGPTPQAVAQLERMGLSREVIVNALLGEFHRRWDMRIAEMEARHAPRPVPPREYIELARLRDADQVRAMKDALGEDGYLAWDKEQTLRMVNMGGVRLSAEEAERVYRMQKEFDEEYRAQQMALEDGVADVADVTAASAQARERLDRDIEALLGRPRFDQLRGSADPVTDMYRKYGDLGPTMDQAQAALEAEEAHRVREADLAARLRAAPGESTAVMAEMLAMSEAKDESLRRIFGAAAYDAMRRRNDATYMQLTQFAPAWDLTAQEVDSVYEPLRAFHDQAERARAAAAMREAAGQRVDWREIDASIEQARRQTEAGLAELIGDRRLERLKQHGLLTVR